MHKLRGWYFYGPIEIFRTAPLGTLFVLWSAGQALRCVAFSDSALASATILVVSTCNAFLGLVLVRRQLHLRKKVEEKLQNGFDEDFLRKTTREWCARQTVRTVLRHDKSALKDYDIICEEQKAHAELVWLPHI